MSKGYSYYLEKEEEGGRERGREGGRERGREREGERREESGREREGGGTHISDISGDVHFLICSWHGEVVYSQ